MAKLQNLQDLSSNSVETNVKINAMLAKARDKYHDIFNNNNVYLGVENCAENDESDSNDDSESQSIDMNATTIDNDASDDVATRVRYNTCARAKAREERARSVRRPYPKS